MKNILRKLYFVLPGKKVDDVIHLLAGQSEFQCNSCDHLFSYKYNDGNGFSQCRADLWTEELAKSNHKHFKCKYYRAKVDWPRS